MYLQNYFRTRTDNCTDRDQTHSRCEVLARFSVAPSPADLLAARRPRRRRTTLPPGGETRSRRRRHSARIGPHSMPRENSTLAGPAPTRDPFPGIRHLTPQLGLQRFPRRRFTLRLQPSFKIRQTNGVLDCRILDGNVDTPVAWKARGPVMFAKNLQSPALRHCARRPSRPSMTLCMCAAPQPGAYQFRVLFARVPKATRRA
jgi:hypothetical protein